MDGRYQWKWNIVMLADCCWCLKQDETDIFYERRSNSRSFEEKRKKFDKTF